MENMMPIPIRYVAEYEGDAPREIIRIANTWFYKSSGANSGMPNTWLPIKGVEYPGTFIKPHLPNIYSCRGPIDTIIELPHRRYDDETEQRFGNEHTMFISAFMGGGIWQSEEHKFTLADNSPLLTPDERSRLSSPSTTTGYTQQAQAAQKSRVVVSAKELRERILHHLGYDHTQVPETMPVEHTDQTKTFTRKTIPDALMPEPAPIPPADVPPTMAAPTDDRNDPFPEFTREQVLEFFRDNGLEQTGPIYRG